MSANHQSMSPDAGQEHYSLSTAAKMARVTVEFIQTCEREDLIRATAVGNASVYAYNMVCRLIRIRHLHRDLGFDLSAIDCLLRMRRQVTNLQRRLGEMEQQMSVRERELMDEIQCLRRKLAHNGNWQKR